VLFDLLLHIFVTSINNSLSILFKRAIKQRPLTNMRFMFTLVLQLGN